MGTYQRGFCVNAPNTKTMRYRFQPKENSFAEALLVVLSTALSLNLKLRDGGFKISVAITD